MSTEQQNKPVVEDNKQKEKENNNNNNNKKQDKKDKKKDKQQNQQSQAAASPASLPEFVARRVAMWEAIEKKQAEERGPEQKIEITLPDGKKIDGVAHVTSPLDIAKQISKSLAERVVISKVNGQLRDLNLPLEASCRLELFDFSSNEGKHVFWHSSAHILGQALEVEYNARLCIGPPLEDGGFYYDCEMGDRKVVQEDYVRLEEHINKLVKDKHTFKRMMLSKQEAMEMFKENPFKLEIIQNKVPDGEKCSAYRCGPFIDLCKGPHLPDTGRVKAFSVTKNSSAYWLGDATKPSLQRVYGVSFPDKKLLKEYEEFVRLAALRDHRKIGPEQELYFFNPDVSPGCCFFLPHGTRIYNKLMDFIRVEYRRRGFQEVITPNVFNVSLWKTSGHYENYKENMFLFNCEDQEFGMKPMNCPGHCMMFKHSLHSYRDLPLRMADFGVLHRNEFSGALSGLTRVRRFQQDDAHIFCRENQIEQEVTAALDFLNFVYGKFGFEFELNLSTRPEKFLGELSQWDEAEKALANCLDKFGKEWKLNPGDGAFYGPKIDIRLTDALKRKHQCATIQLDFQLPRRFELQYKAEDGTMHFPVIIHRAVLGSLERMIAVLTEHTGGKWPLWISPRQVIVVPIAPTYIEYAVKVRDMFFQAGFFADVDDSNDQFKKKIAMAQVQQYNFILVVGEEEVNANAVNIRSRDNRVLGMKSIADFITELNQLIASYQ